MTVYKLTQIGQFHTNHCEDHSIFRKLGENRYVLAVMDGCSSGFDSFFASALLGKIISKVAMELEYKEFAEKSRNPIKEQLKEVTNRVFNQLKSTKHSLLLKKEELLSTLILCVIDTHEKLAEIISIGDGLISYNGNLVEYEQDNKPDYLAYHLEQDFEKWYNSQQQFLSIKEFEDLSITTDGIFSFSAFDTGEYPPITENEIIELLLHNKDECQSQRMLPKKLRKIEQEFGLKPNDDLSIVRVIRK